MGVAAPNRMVGVGNDDGSPLPYACAALYPLMVLVALVPSTSDSVGEPITEESGLF